MTEEFQQKIEENEVVDAFGFSFKSGEEINKNELDALRRKLTKVRTVIFPFLNKLKESPDKAYIHWPDRQNAIDKFMKELDKAFDGD